MCDCHLKWLAELVLIRPSLDISDAKCFPVRKRSKRTELMSRQQKLIDLSVEKHFKCSPSEDSDKEVVNRCPQHCTCEQTVVDCSNRQLKDMPKDVPIFATELRLNDNHIQRIRNNGLFKRSNALVKLDLRNNQIVDIEDQAFNGLHSLNDLLLTDNKLKQLRSDMFLGLKNLTHLRIEHNFVEELPNKVFEHMKRVSKIDLSKNNITDIASDAFRGLTSLTSLYVMQRGFTASQ